MSATTSRLSSLLIAASAVLLFGAPGVALAQQNPNVERGVSPAKAYQLGEIDTTNLFNGTLNLRLAIGQTFRVNGILSYGLTAHYATNAWAIGTHRETIFDPFMQVSESQYAYPDRHANAGFGWLVTFGEIIRTDSNQLAYLSPDGTQRLLYDKLHANDPDETVDPNVFYTRDGTYLRVRKLPDATYEVHFPNGVVHKFAAAGMLTRMEDPYGNWMTVTAETRTATEAYPGTAAHAGSPKWRINDSVGREHVIYFRPAHSYSESHDPNASTPHTVIDYVDFSGPPGGDGRARYRFDYSSTPDAVASGTTPLTRRCMSNSDFDNGSTMLVSMLTGIQMPEGVRYEMDYWMGNEANYCQTVNAVGPAGNLRRLRLPTGGLITWDYADYQFPSSDDSGMAQVQSANSGVSSRKVYASTTETSPLMETLYTPQSLDTEFPSRHTLRKVTNKHAGAVLTETHHYFATCLISGCSYRGLYGLPVSPVAAASGGAFLSTQTYAPNAQGVLTLRRSTYVAYEGDGNLASSAPIFPDLKLNQRIRFQRTIYEDGRISDVSSSNFDGLGHYRQEETAGTFPGSNRRATYTNFNPSAGRYDVSSGGTLTSSFTRPATTSPWILSRFDIQRVKEWDANDVATSSTSRSCFDATGFLTSRRAYRAFGDAPADSGDDVLQVLTRDGAGNLVREQLIGGDADDGGATGWPEAGPPAPVPFTCGSSVSGEAYRIRHTYQHGSLRTSYYADGADAPLSFFNVDHSIDNATGYPTKSCTASTHAAGGTSNQDGQCTSFEYDKLGRQTKTINPGPNGGHTRFVYRNSPPRVDVYDEASDGAVLRHSAMDMDVLGRIVREERAMPGTTPTTAVRETQYNALGWKTAESGWDAPGALKFTMFAYDFAGRPVAVTTPDGFQTTLSYTGVEQVQRTVSVRTSAASGTAGMTAATTTEKFDRFGRLTSVTEPNSVVMAYKYDVGGRLISVCVNQAQGCPQPRTFSYDNLGRLRVETHPELGDGVAGGTTRYLRYDAAGHLLRKVTGADDGPFDLSFHYDRAGRLEKLHETRTLNGLQRHLKEFTYGTSNAGDNKRNGKLLTAVRHNWLNDLDAPIDYNVQVVETYAYTDLGGRASSRKTENYLCVPSAANCNSVPTGTLQQSFEQSFTYDLLGSVASVTYPHCTVAPCSSISVARTVTNSYDQGWLTNVSWPGGANALTYHRNGLWHQVTHANGVVDTQELDNDTRMARPHLLQTTNVIDAAACVKPSFTDEPESQSVAPNTAVTLTAAASGQNNDAISYTWFSGVHPSGTQVGTGSSLNVTVTGSASYWVRATNSCGFTDSASATLSTCSVPTVTAAANRSITRTMTTTLTPSVAGSGSLTYQWYTVLNGVASEIHGATAFSLAVTPTATTVYRMTARNACGTTTSGSMTVTVFDPPTAPTAVVAEISTDGATARAIWAASFSQVGILRYEVQRAYDGGPFVAHATVSPPTLQSLDNGIVSGKAYVYRVRAVDTNGIPSEYGEPDVTAAIAWVDWHLPGQPIRGIHIGQLRQAIDGLRRTAGLPLMWSSYAAATGLVRASHIGQMREALDEARRVLRLQPIAYGDAFLFVGQTQIKASHLVELREGVQ